MTRKILNGSDAELDIAYYSHGNVPKPEGILHDDAGEPILKKGELILTKDMDAGCEVTKPSSGLTGAIFSTLVFPDLGSGNLYRTDRRVIFLRVPPLSRYLDEGRKLSEDPSEFMRTARDWASKGWRESVSIRTSEVKTTKRKRKDREFSFEIEFEGARYIARFTPSVRPFL